MGSTILSLKNILSNINGIFLRINQMNQIQTISTSLMNEKENSLFRIRLWNIGFRGIILGRK